MKEHTKTRRTFLKVVGNGSIAAAGAMFSRPKTVRAAKNTGNRKLRIMVGGFHHETNTFNPHKSDVEDFKRGARYGNDVLNRRSGCTGGFIDIADMYDVELIGSITAGSSQGMVTKGAFDYVTGVMLDTLDKHHVDAVYFYLHGGGVKARPSS